MLRVHPYAPVSGVHSRSSMVVLTALVLLGCWASHSQAQWGIANSTVNFTQSRIKVRPFDEELSFIDFHDGEEFGPGISCAWGACAGFKLWASGDADLDLRAKMFAGGNYSMAYQAKQTTWAAPLVANQPVNSEFLLVTGFEPVGITKLLYMNTLIDADISVVGSLSASIGGKGCFVGCVSGSVKPPPVTVDVDLLHVKNGTVEVLGVNVGSLPFDYSDERGIVSVVGDMPNFGTTFPKPGMPPTSTVQYSDEKTVLKLSVDAAAALAAALSLPPLHGSVGPVDYNLLTAQGWAGLSMKDTFELNAQVASTTYTFSSAVQVLDDASGTWSAPTTSLTLPDGQARKLRAPGAAKLGILPTYNLQIQGSTGTEAIAAVGYDVSALEVGAFGESIGPLFHEKDDWPVATFGIASESLADTATTKGKPLTLEFQPVVGEPLNLEQSTFIPVAVFPNDDGSVTEQYGRIVNATDPLCIRDPARCELDRTFPVVQISSRPDPDPDLPYEVADDFVLLAELLSSELHIDSEGTSIERVLRELAAEFDLVLEGPPTDIPVGPGYPPLTEPVSRSEVVVLGYPGVQIPGDYDQDDALTAADLNRLTRQILAGGADSIYDLTDNGRVDDEDRIFWVLALMGTVVGDAGLDGQFSSDDFVQVFAAGKYETRVFAGWEEGDWSGDGRFDSGDFVVAFQAGAYEQGPRRAAELVPEPASLVLLLLGLIGCARVRRTH